MDSIEVPQFFVCPISLEIMKDPVTVSTGITYDRDSIEKWLFTEKHDTCPVTKQVLTNTDQLTPNVTLRRLIQSWCSLNASNGIERFPTPRAPISKPQLVKLLSDAAKSSPQMQIKSLKRLKSIASENETNKRCMEAAGVAEFLVALVMNHESNDELSPTSSSEDSIIQASEIAINILHNIRLSDEGVKSILNQRNGKFVESLVRVMQRGSYEPRAYSILLLKSMSELADHQQLNNLKQEFFIEIVQILKDQISQKSTKAAMKLLINICPHGRNRIKAVEAGAVRVLIDLLLDCLDKRASEMMLILLEILCQCAEGRAELLRHGAGLAMVSKKILRVSIGASERAVKILHSVSKFSATPVVVQEMLSLGVAAKLCLVIQVDCGTKTKERAREILKMHARAWRNSLCIPTNLRCAYPPC